MEKNITDHKNISHINWNYSTLSYFDFEFEIDEIQYLAQNPAPLTGEDLEQFERLLELLDDNDDVQNVYHSVEL